MDFNVNLNKTITSNHSIWQRHTLTSSNGKRSWKMRLILAPPDSSAVSIWSPEPSMHLSKSTENCCTILWAEPHISRIYPRLKPSQRLHQLTGAEPWFCGRDRQVWSSCTPPPPSRWREADSAAWPAVLAGCPGCGWWVAVRVKDES